MYDPIFRLVAVLAFFLNACAYSQITPAGQSVISTVNRPAGDCRSLGTVTGKGGGGGGGYVSNERLIEYAYNDLRNKSAMLGATHVHTQAPALGSTGEVTTSASVVGEALKCSRASRASTAGTASPAVSPAKATGCQYDTQCKGDRICVQGMCQSPEGQ